MAVLRHRGCSPTSCRRARSARPSPRRPRRRPRSGSCGCAGPAPRRSARGPCRRGRRTGGGGPARAPRSRRSAGRSGHRAAAPGSARPPATSARSSPAAARAPARPGLRFPRSPGRGDRAPIGRPRTACPADGRRRPSSPRATGRDGRTSRNTAARLRGGAAALRRLAAKLSPSSGICGTPLIVSGGAMPTVSSSVGVRSLAWQNWWRSSPRAGRPFGQLRSPADRGCRRRGCSACSA